MTRDLEQRILALAAALGARDPKITKRPTTGRGSKSYRKGFEVFVPCGVLGGESADGASEEAAGEAVLRRLIERARDLRDSARIRAEQEATQAARLHAALTAALTSVDGGAA